MSANVETMFSVREKPWHGLGTIVHEAPTSKEALQLAGLDWAVRQEQIVYKDQESGYFMNIRSTDDKVLGVVGSRYKPVQNVDAFDFMDGLIGEGVTYETAGSLNTGKRIWLLAKMPDIAIFDDVIEPYMCLTNCHDGFGSLKVCMTPVRVVCQNTLNLALGSAKRSWNGRHTGSIDNKMIAAKETLGLATTYMNSFRNSAEELHNIKIAPSDFDALQSQMFPITKDMTDRKIDSQLLLRDQLKHAWDMDDLGNIRGTGWGFMNAVSDMATHKPPVRKSDNYQENAFMYVLDAPTILDAAMKLMNARATA